MGTATTITIDNINIAKSLSKHHRNQPTQKGKIMKYGIFIVMAAVSGCTFQQQEGEIKSEFHPPLTYAAWNTEQYTSTTGKPVCVVSSGHRGLSVMQHRMPDGTISVSAKGERKLTPGMEFNVNVNGNHYRTSQEYFSSSESLKLAEDLSTEGKAYLEWSEPHGSHHNRLRTSNIVKLEGFRQQFEQCKAALAKPSAKNVRRKKQ